MEALCLGKGLLKGETVSDFFLLFMHFSPLF